MSASIWLCVAATLSCVPWLLDMCAVSWASHPRDQKQERGWHCLERSKASGKSLPFHFNGIASFPEESIHQRSTQAPNTHLLAKKEKIPMNCFSSVDVLIALAYTDSSPSHIL